MDVSLFPDGPVCRHCGRTFSQPVWDIMKSGKAYSLICKCGVTFSKSVNGQTADPPMPMSVLDPPLTRDDVEEILQQRLGHA